MIGAVHPAWCLGTEAEGEPHESTTLHAARPTDVADIRLRLVQLEGVLSVKLELMEDNATSLYLLPPEQAQALIASTVGLLSFASQTERAGAFLTG